MILKELELIKSVLENYLNSESCVNNLETDDTDLAIKTIDREIRLKTMDPRKEDFQRYDKSFPLDDPRN